MRSFLGFVVFTAVFIAVLGLVLVPIVVPPIVVASVRHALPFGDTPVAVRVDVDAVQLSRGVIGEIHISGQDLVAGQDAEVGSIDLTIDDVRLDRRGFGSVRGSLKDAVVRLADGTMVAIGEIEVSGPSSDLHAVATIAPAEVLRLVQTGLVNAGVDPTRIELVDGGVALDVLGQPVQVALRVEAGALVIASSFGGGPVVLIGPEPGDPWHLVSADISPAGVVLDASMDAPALLAGS